MFFFPLPFLLSSFRLFETLQSLFWSIFGLLNLYVTNVKARHEFTEFVGATMFGTYNVISLVVLLNMLIAMMNNSYQLIAVSTEHNYPKARNIYASMQMTGQQIASKFPKCLELVFHNISCTDDEYIIIIIIILYISITPFQSPRLLYKVRLEEYRHITNIHNKVQFPDQVLMSNIQKRKKSVIKEVLKERCLPQSGNHNTKRSGTQSYQTKVINNNNMIDLGYEELYKRGLIP